MLLQLAVRCRILRLNCSSVSSGSRCKPCPIAAAHRPRSRLPPARSPWDCSTLREAGVPNFNVSSWLALFAPRGKPDDRVDGLNAEIAKIAAVPEAQKVLLAAGLEPAPNSPSEMRRIIEADHKRWGQLIQARGLRAE